MNNEEVRPTANLIISTCSAYDYLNHSNPNLEKLTTQYYETFSITDRFTGYFSNITIGDFYNTLSTDLYDSTAILGGLNATARKNQEKNSSQSSSSRGSSSGSESSGGESSSQTINPPDTDKTSKISEIITNPEQLTAGTSSIIGDRGTENFGIAIFKDDKICGKLTATETICHLLINNKIDSCIISIDNPLNKDKQSKNSEVSEKMELQLFPRKNSKISLNIINDKPIVDIKLFINAEIMTLIKDTNYETNEALSRISDSAKKYLEEQFNDYLRKVAQDLNVDIDQFSIKAPAHFATISDFEKFNWPEKYKNTEFKVDIDVNVISSMLLTKT